MKKQIAIALAALGSTLAGTAAHAGNVQWSVGISAPPIATVISNGPVYAPVYAPAPVVYAPQPVYVDEPVVYAPPPRVVYRPVPVVVRGPGYYRPAPVVVYGGGYGGGYGGYYRTGYHHHSGWRDHEWHDRNGGWDDQTRRHH